MIEKGADKMNLIDNEFHRATFLSVIDGITTERIRSGYPESHRDRARFVVEAAREIADRAVYVNRPSPLCSDKMIGFACTSRELSMAFDQLAETIENCGRIPERALTRILDAATTLLSELDMHTADPDTK
jgi:hypothetical protein